MKIDKVDALHSLRPNSLWALHGNVLNWEDSKQTEPTEAEIDAEVIRLQAEYDAQDYARNRKAEYNALNQLEMQFDDKEDGTTTWEDAIKAIKTKWPKDNSGPV